MKGPQAGFAGTQAALIALQPIWHGATDPWALLMVLLLIPPWVGVLRGAYRAGLLSALIMLLPFCHGIMRLAEGGGDQGLAQIEAGLCTAAFIALVLWAARRRRERIAD